MLGFILTSLPPPLENFHLNESKGAKSLNVKSTIASLLSLPKLVVNYFGEFMPISKTLPSLDI